jgi:hypothetical protein
MCVDCGEHGKTGVSDRGTHGGGVLGQQGVQYVIETHHGCIPLHLGKWMGEVRSGGLGGSGVRW